MSTEIQPAHRKRPDPDEPYRYVCLDCGTHRITRLRTDKRPHNKTYKTVEGGRDAEADRRKNFKCHGCNERKEHLLDKKTGEEVVPR